jgi:hypothetical protein
MANWARFILIAFVIYDIYFIRRLFVTYNRRMFRYVESITPRKYTPANKEMITTILSKEYLPDIDNLNHTSEILPDQPFAPENLFIDNTDSLIDEDLSCQPDTFGYSIEEGNAIFPKYPYPRCEDKYDTERRIWIDFETNMLYMNCPGKYKGHYVVGPLTQSRLVLHKEITLIWDVKEYSKPVRVPSNTEFALGSCEEDLDAKFNEAFLMPRFNQTAYDKAKALTTGKPKVIFMLTVDSYSRRHFYRSLPKTIDYLNSLNQDSDLLAYDFKLHNVLGSSSIENQVPIFVGKEKYADGHEGDQEVDFLGDAAIWNLLREKGYISLLGLENCDSYFPKSIGRRPNVDYGHNWLYCAAYRFSDYRMEKEALLKQRCIGPHMSHYYVFEYIKEVSKMNRGVNQFLYTHINAAHEGTGLHAQTLDEDLLIFLKDFINMLKQDHDVLIFLQADHGMRYGNWYKSLAAYQENKLPAFFLITQRDFVNSTNTYPYLQHNTIRLTSKLDLRKSILWLGGVDIPVEGGFNLFTEKINRKRTCTDALIEPWDCSCLPFYPLTDIDEDVQNLINELGEYVVHILNHESYVSYTASKGSICKQLSFKKAEKIYVQPFSNVEEVIRFEIRVQESKSFQLQANILVSSYDDRRMEYSEYQYNPEPYVFRGVPLQYRIINTSRLDRYAGPCEVKSRAHGIRAESCVCDDSLDSEE